MWVDIKGYNGLYSISSEGDVKSNAKKITTSNGSIRFVAEKILKKIKRKEGYYAVTLYYNGIVKQHYIHRLVAENFLNNNECKKCVNHKDGNKLNNNILNLEWCTYTENNNHALKLKLRINPSGKRNGFSKKIVVNGIEYFSIKEYADKVGISIHSAYYKARVNKWTTSTTHPTTPAAR